MTDRLRRYRVELYEPVIIEGLSRTMLAFVREDAASAYNDALEVTTEENVRAVIDVGPYTEEL